MIICVHNWIRGKTDRIQDILDRSMPLIIRVPQVHSSFFGSQQISTERLMNYSKTDFAHIPIIGSIGKITYIIL